MYTYFTYFFRALFAIDAIAYSGIVIFLLISCDNYPITLFKVPWQCMLSQSHVCQIRWIIVVIIFMQRGFVWFENKRTIILSRNQYENSIFLYWWIQWGLQIIWFDVSYAYLRWVLYTINCRRNSKKMHHHRALGWICEMMNKKRSCKVMNKNIYHSAMTTRRQFIHSTKSLFVHTTHSVLHQDHLDNIRFHVMSAHPNCAPKANNRIQTLVICCHPNRRSC